MIDSGRARPTRSRIAGDAAFVHHRHAVAVGEDLFHVAADHHDRRAAVGQVAHQSVDLRLGADVDASRRLVEHDDPRRQRQPAAPARPSAGCRRSGCRPWCRCDAVFTCSSLGDRAARRPPQRRGESSPKRRVAPERRQRDVLAHAHRRDQSDATPILGNRDRCRAGSRLAGDEIAIAAPSSRTWPATAAPGRRKAPRPARSALRRPVRRHRESRRAGRRAKSRARDNEPCAAPRSADMGRPTPVSARLARVDTSRPTIMRTIRSREISSRASEPALRPSRSTTTRSASASISPRRCEM